MVLLSAAVVAEPQRPKQLGLCASCHGEDGCRGVREIPLIAGQNPAYLVAALGAYRDGQRNHAAMHAIAGALSIADIDTFAQWYGAQDRSCAAR